MPPAKSRAAAPEDSRSEASVARDAPSMTTNGRKGKNGGAAAQQNGSSLKALALVSTESGNVIAPGQGNGMSWHTAPRSLLNSYRVAHGLATPAAFTSPLNQARLTTSSIGAQSPTMARKKDKRRVSKEQLALAVRKHFNGAAVNEIDVVVELVYKIRNQDKAFRLRSTPGISKK